MVVAVVVMLTVMTRMLIVEGRDEGAKLSDGKLKKGAWLVKGPVQSE